MSYTITDKSYIEKAWNWAFNILFCSDSIHPEHTVNHAKHVLHTIDSELASILLADEASAAEETTEEPSNTVTLYHGTHEQHITFTDREIKNYNSIGTWLTESPDMAKMYGKYVHTVKVTLNNPLIVNGINSESAFDKFFFNQSIAGKATMKDINKLLLNADYMTKFKSNLVQQGYDGIIFSNSTIDCSEGEQHTVYIIFDADSIK